MSRQEPISVEDLIKKKREKNNGPKFLSKAQREKLALERRAKEVGQQKHNTQQESENPERSSIERKNSISTNQPQDNNEREQNSKRKRNRDKFTFEWKETDDTIDENDPLYNPRKVDQAVRADGGGIEERKRREQRLEEFRTRKQTKMDWDEVHWTEKPLDKMKERDWRIFKEDYSIVTKGGLIPNPMRFWDESTIPQKILNTVHKVGYKEPTPIQRAAIPIALAGRDVIGVAETGSGKTAGFVIPLLSYIMELPKLNEKSKHEGPYAIILAPTRELAQQIERETQRFCDPLGFRSVSVVGGHSIEEQILKLQEGAEIIIATPGRLVDCLERRLIVLNQCCYVIMDEADRMIDLGFEDSVNTILSELPVSNKKPENENDADNTRYRQTMMFTATWPRAIQKMADNYLRRPGTVTIGNLGQATDRVEQRVEFVADEEQRKKRLVQILNTDKYSPPIIIFVNYTKTCETVAKSLNAAGWHAVTMHGQKNQERREAALAKLRSGEADVLVATDVAGRGIDVKDVSLVINFQMARTIEDYTHRIGRTGRAGKKGTAITFLGQGDDDLLYDLKQMIARSEASKLSDDLRRHPAAQTRPSIAKKLVQQDDDGQVDQ